MPFFWQSVHVLNGIQYSYNFHSTNCNFNNNHSKQYDSIHCRPFQVRASQLTFSTALAFWGVYMPWFQCLHAAALFLDRVGRIVYLRETKVNRRRLWYVHDLSIRCNDKHEPIQSLQMDEMNQLDCGDKTPAAGAWCLRAPGISFIKGLPPLQATSM